VIRPLAIALAAALASVGSAAAQVDLFSRDRFSGIADVRLAASEGERSWTDGGFGKTRSGGGDDGLHLGDASLVWKPRLSWSLGATIDVRLDPEDEARPVDVVEAFATFKPTPRSATRAQVRAGLFYPPISLEHGGVAWTVTDTITPSAINSWVGEEVKVAGVEALLTRSFAEHELGVAAALFGANDTAGTLLSFRGWALHDIKAGARQSFDLPALSAFMRVRQAPVTTPILELDDRAGGYVAVDWRPPWGVALNALYYDNGGDRRAVRAREWAWDTRFTSLGATWQVDEQTRVLAQVMWGETLMGFQTPGGIWVDVGFASAYVLASRRMGRSTLTGRLDWFATEDRTLQLIDNNDEDGWAATAAYRYALRDGIDLRLEALQVWSDRPSRRYGLTASKQQQTTLQSSLRLSF
jgi:hypothetical protein